MPVTQSNDNEEKLALLQKSLEERAAQNESVHERTLDAIDNSVRVQEQRLNAIIVDAQARGDQDAVDAAAAKTAALPETKAAQLRFEGDRYNSEKQTVQQEQKGIEEMLAQHQAERAAQEKQFDAERSALAERWEKEGTAQPEPVRDPNADPVTRAVDLIVTAYEAAKAMGVKVAGMELQDIENLRGVAEAAKLTYVEGKDLAPDAVREALPMSDGRIDTKAREAEQADRDNPTSQNKAFQDTHREDVERAMEARQEQERAALAERQREEVDRKLERTGIEIER